MKTQGERLTVRVGACNNCLVDAGTVKAQIDEYIHPMTSMHILINYHVTIFSTHNASIIVFDADVVGSLSRIFANIKMASNRV